MVAVFGGCTLTTCTHTMNAYRLFGTAALLAALTSAPHGANAQGPAPLDPPAFVQLEGPLTPTQSARLAADGIDVLHYYGHGRYLLSAAPTFGSALPPERLPATALPEASVARAQPELLRAGPGGSKTVARATVVDVALVLAYPKARAHLRALLRETGFSERDTQFGGGVTLEGSVSVEGLARLLEHPLILDASPLLEQDALLNDRSRFEHRTTVLSSDLPTAANLTGAGVVVGVGDGGHLSPHPDIGNRINHTTPWYNAGWGVHPDFVAGLIAGAGVVRPEYRGAAPEAELLVELSTNVTYYALPFHDEHGMTLTNNSYAPYFSCETANRYHGFAADVDQQLLDEPELLHVFAAGNAGRQTCTGYEAPFGTLSSGGQCAKNVLTVANGYVGRGRYASSSSGPTLDGRLKPEITAVGHGVWSNDRARDYTHGSGTSYAAPAVTGMLALLTEEYRRLHDGANPTGALLKALTCNTADDLGRPGPDYETGFGMISGTTAVEALRAGRHASAALPALDTAAHTLEVLPGQEEFRVMLYWNDRPGATTNDRALLVDDLDLLVVTPAGDTLRPWVLDPRHPAAEATRGRDSLNNIEQVTLTLPAAGDYRVLVAGRAQAYGATDYVLTWTSLAPAIQLVHPFGGERLEPGTTDYIAWETSPLQTGTWHAEYAVDDGPWVTIRRNIPNVNPWIEWTLPETAGAYRFRITNEASGLTDETDAPVTLLPVPQAIELGEVCSGAGELSWTPVAEATAYEIYRFDGDAMVLVGEATDPRAVVEGIDPEALNIFSVAARTSAGSGPRATALVLEPGTVTEAPDDSPCTAPVPVVWEDVRLEGRQGYVSVYWTVSEEREADYFALERGVEGVTGTLRWTEVTRVSARGEAISSQTYAADDFGAADAPTRYYRVRQVDRDGTADYSETLVYRRGGRSAPDPVEIYNGARASVRNTGPNPVDLLLADGAGRVLYRRRVGAGTVADLPPALPSGVYALQWRASGGGVGVVRLVR